MLAAHQDPRQELAGVAGRIGPILPTGPLQRPPTVRNHVRVACKAVIFDIGGVLEVTPSTGWRQRWARRLGLELEEMVDRLEPIWSRGDLGLISLSDVEQQTANALASQCARRRRSCSTTFRSASTEPAASE